MKKIKIEIFVFKILMFYSLRYSIGFIKTMKADMGDISFSFILSGDFEVAGLTINPYSNFTITEGYSSNSRLNINWR